MCGIAGFSSFNLNFLEEESKWNFVLNDIGKTINKRGPDGMGTYLNKNIALYHSRLSIIDIENGSQPISIKINNKIYHIIYNGEIYNTYELKKDLIEKGYKFSTKSDTEVILIGFIHYGEEYVKNLNGLFSIAIWDDSKKELFLFRDRSGIKPLFYTIKNNILIFGSEIKVLLQFPGIEAILDENGLLEIFALGPARSEGNGVFKNFKEICPGHYAKFNKNGFKEICYWKLEAKKHIHSHDETIQQISFLIKDSIKRQLVSDVEISTLLSGGIDSSIITTIASKELSSQGKLLNTYSFDFEDNNKYFKSNSFQPDQDRPWIEKLVKNLKTNHTFLECSSEKLLEYTFKSVDAKDLPGMTDVDGSLLYFCEQISKTNKVTLSGECADEIFGGYPWFHKKDMLETHNFPWSKNIDMRNLLLNKDLTTKINLEKYSKNSYEKTIKEVPTLESDSKEEKRIREITYLNIKWFMTTLLDRMDRASMYSALESRVPYADHRIIEYMFNVPWSIKYKDNITKYSLRKSAEDILPESLLYRKKSPYPKIYNPKYTNLVIEMIYNLIENKNEPIYSLLNINSIKTFINNIYNYEKPWFGQLMCSTQLLAYILQINYWLKKYKVRISI